jgi:YesN/AraC family two-component response regulator
MAKEIKKLELGTLMIFLTNFSDIEHISEAISVDVTDYLVKSEWSIGDISEKIKKKLGLK